MPCYRLLLEQGTRVECVLTSGVVEVEGQPGVSMAVGIASLKQDDLATVKPARLELLSIFCFSGPCHSQTNVNRIT